MKNATGVNRLTTAEEKIGELEDMPQILQTKIQTKQKKHNRIIKNPRTIR